MRVPFRAIRAAVSALFVAAAVGTGGMVGMTSALAVDPTTVGLTGTIVDADGTPLGGVHVTIAQELPPDGGAAAFPAVTAADGSFAVEINAWGTARAPATLTIETPAGETTIVIDGACTRTWAVAVAVNLQVALADAAPDPLTVTATTTLRGEVCGTTATPPPNGGGGGAHATPPATDVAPAAVVGPADRVGPALAIGFVVGLLAAALLLSRRGARGRP